MGKAILRLAEDEYVEWSTVVDAPVTYVMTRSEALDAGYAEERLARADRNGHSFCDGYAMSLDDVLTCNRAGPDESELHLEDIRWAYRPEFAA